MVGNLANVHPDLAGQVAERLGLPAPADAAQAHPRRSSPALSLVNQLNGELTGRKVALVGADGVDGDQVRTLADRLATAGIAVRVLAPHAGELTSSQGRSVPVNQVVGNDSSTFYDAVVLLGDLDSIGRDGDVAQFVAEAYRHGKPIGVLAAQDHAQAPLPPAALGLGESDGILFSDGTDDSAAGFAERLSRALAAHRFPERG